GFQFVDQNLKLPLHNGVGHYLKGEDAQVSRFITQLNCPSHRVLLEAGGVVASAAKARQQVARNSMVSRTCPFISAARRSYSSACDTCGIALPTRARDNRISPAAISQRRS